MGGIFFYETLSPMQGVILGAIPFLGQLEELKDLVRDPSLFRLTLLDQIQLCIHFVPGGAEELIFRFDWSPAVDIQLGIIS